MSLLITELVNTQAGDIGCLAKKKKIIHWLCKQQLHLPWPKAAHFPGCCVALGHFLLRAVSAQQLPQLILMLGYQSTHTQTKPAEKAWPCKESPPPALGRCQCHLSPAGTHSSQVLWRSLGELWERECHARRANLKSFSSSHLPRGERFFYLL